MKPTLYECQRFEGINLDEQMPERAEYYKCTFTRCSFRKTDLSDFEFDQCTFEECDLTMAVLKNAVMRDVNFVKCKLMGVDFSVCNTFGIRLGFRECILDYSIFFKLKLPKTVFSGSSLREAEFAEADLSGARFENCNLENAGFNYTNLEKADLSTAFNYRIDPEINRLRRAKFAYPALAGLLSKYDIIIEE